MQAVASPASIASRARVSAVPPTESPNPTSMPEAIRTFLFTDIEGSTRLWEQEPQAMRAAVAHHDAVSRQAVEGAGGRVVKTTGDGVHAVFDDALHGLRAALALQQAMASPASALDGAAAGPVLRVRCGLHCGESEARDGDFFGPVLNRAARVMAAAHGGQTLLTQAVAERVAGRLPPGASLLDLGTVRLRDLASPERLHQLQHPALRDRFPPLRSLEATPNNLAQQLNSFVGRERELKEVRELLGRTRLLTLLGVGGIGKSRLSVQLGAELLDEYPDGVWLVELAPLTDPRGVPQAVASVLGVKEEAGLGVVDALRAFVRERRLLLILDNCEHVLQACAELAKQLLQAGAGLRILTSSRDVLQIAGETVYALPTLTVPASDDATDLATLTRHEAVRLFLDRAQAVMPSFRLDPGNAAAVAEICRRLDGIALALELAAARIRVLSVQAIAERLSDRFRLLVTGDKTVLPRQRTLRALIDWSFDLLDEDERMLFRRLAVFAGGWTLESAEAACAGNGLDAPDVLDLLARLVEKSLALMDAGGARYRMLETVRAYALEKLAQAGDETPTRARHLDHFLGLAEAARPHLAGPVQGLWLKRLDVERENFVAAYGVSEQQGRADLGVRLMHALRPYLITRGDLSTGLRFATALVHGDGLGERDAARCMALFGAGQFSFYLGRHAEARAWLRECAEIAREIANTPILARTLQPLGAADLAEGDVAAARQHLEEAVSLAREQGDARELASALNLLAMLYRMEGEYSQAEPLFEQVIATARALGDSESTALGLLNLAMNRISSASAPSALPMLREVLGIARETGSQPVWQSVTEVGVGLAASLGEFAEAARLYGAAEAQSEAARRPRYVADQAFLNPLLERTRLQLGPAAFEAELQAGRQTTAAAQREALSAWLERHSAPASSALSVG